MNPVQDLPLRDIHLPEAVSWWPPAIGWWLLIVLVLLSIFALYWLIKKIREPKLNKSARVEVSKVLESYQQSQDKIALIQQLSMAMRRIGISYLPRVEYARVSGENWYRELNGLVKDNQLSDQTIKLLTNAPYQKQPQFEEDEVQNLIIQIQAWVKQLPAQASSVRLKESANV